MYSDPSTQRVYSVGVSVPRAPSGSPPSYVVPFSGSRFFLGEEGHDQRYLQLGGADLEPVAVAAYNALIQKCIARRLAAYRPTLLPELCSCSTVELWKAFEVPASPVRCALIRLRTPALLHPDFRSSQGFPALLLPHRLASPGMFRPNP